MLTRNHSIVGIEDLGVAGMVKNERLARFVSLMSLGEFRKQMRYKAELYGRTVVEADTFFLSSKICSCCGVKSTDLKLSDRNWTCPACGRYQDRDRNGAIDLRDMAARNVLSDLVSYFQMAISNGHDPIGSTATAIKILQQGYKGYRYGKTVSKNDGSSPSMQGADPAVVGCGAGRVRAPAQKSGDIPDKEAASRDRIVAVA